MKSQIQSLSNKYAAAEATHQKATAVYQLEKENILKQNAKAEDQSRQAIEATHTQITELRHQHKHLQSQYAATVDQNHQIAAKEQRKLQTKLERMKAHLRHQTEAAYVTGNTCRVLRNLVAELRHQTTAQLQAFQEEVESYKTQIVRLTQ